MSPFSTHIEQYLYQSFPTTPSTEKNRNEAAWKATLGTKQRRYGPIPPVEEQAAIRKILFENDPVTFFVPTGASKYTPGRMHPDIAEVSMLKQLSCLRAELGRYGKGVKFVFRMEDIADRFLFGDDTMRKFMVHSYADNFMKLVALVLPGSEVKLESDCTSAKAFFDSASSYVEVFKRYLDTGNGTNRLEAIGWKGGIGQDQVGYYQDNYAALGIPPSKWNQTLARYFASVLARHTMGAVLRPAVPHISLGFSHPLPSDPMKYTRLYYRAIPERYTNYHVAPWNAHGYLRISDDGEMTPRYLLKTDTFDIESNTTEWNGVTLDADYQQV